MKIAIQVLDDRNMPASQIYTFGLRMSLVQALMLIQSLMTLSGEFDDPQLDKVSIDRIKAESAQQARHRPVKVATAR